MNIIYNAVLWATGITLHTHVLMLATLWQCEGSHEPVVPEQEIECVCVPNDTAVAPDDVILQVEEHALAVVDTLKVCVWLMLALAVFVPAANG